MKVLITGGHLTPALGVIDALPRDTQVLYVGRKYALEGDSAYSLEYQTITARNIHFEELVTGRLQRHFSKNTIPSLFRTIPGFFNALQIVKKFRPNVILGFGGYVSVPICLAGKLLGIPIVIHEQTLSVGLANKILAPFANRICISWEQSRSFFPKWKTVLTGNPALCKLFELRKKEKKANKPHIVFVGGSLGSHAINILVEQSLEHLLTHFSVFAQTGDAKEFGDFDRLTAKKQTLPKNLRNKFSLARFIDPSEIVSIFTSADIVVTRAGINTLSSLFILEIPSLMLPLPLSREQKQNAHFFKGIGLGEIANDTMSQQTLTQSISAMIKNRLSYANNMNKNIMRMHKNAAQDVFKELIYVQGPQKTQSKADF